MKWLKLALVCFLTLYAPIELTRVIIQFAFVKRLWAGGWEFEFEIVFIWVCYISAMALVAKWMEFEL